MILLSRRTFFAAAAGFCGAFWPARGKPWATDVGVYTEPTLAPCMRAVGRDFTARYGAGVAVLTASPTLLLEQIEHNAAHDLLIVPPDFMDEAEKRNFVTRASRRDAWRDQLVIATRAPAGPRGADPRVVLAAGSVAVTDASIAASLDGYAILQAAGLAGAAQEIVGVATTQDAAFMVTSGATRSALLYLTDVRADATLVAAAALEKVPAAAFSLALNPQPPSRNAAKFLDFLATDHAASILKQAGLEIPA